MIFGLLHGLIMASSLWTWRIRRVVATTLRTETWPPIICTMLQIVGTFHIFFFTAIFFRANTLSEAFYILQHFLTELTFEAPYIYALGSYEFVIAISGILLLETVNYAQEKGIHFQSLILRLPIPLRWLAYYALIFGILIFGEFGIEEFIYFQF